MHSMMRVRRRIEIKELGSGLIQEYRAGVVSFREESSPLGYHEVLSIAPGFWFTQITPIPQI